MIERLVQRHVILPIHASRRLKAVGFVSCLAIITAQAETLTLLNSQAGTTPALLGYNLGHFMPDSNAADWFRYSGVDAARIFINVSDIEPTDDIAPTGDGVNSETAFFNRRALLRANASSTTAALSNAYVNWSVFTGNYGGVLSGNNRIQPSYALANLRDRGISVLVNLTASPSRFPITGASDWAGKWELWQHYYAQAFLQSRDYAVRNYSMFNEPNGWAGMTEADWLVRFRFCSDAIQCAISDMNARYGKALVPQVFAANTGNGAEKYNTIGPDAATTDTWGHDAVANRHLKLDGSTSPAWLNLHVYNYQKYTTRTNAGGGFTGYINDYDALRGYLDADMPGELPLPMALTEFNVRTGALYDTLTATQDSPVDFSALGANLAALTGRGINQIYQFKFGQTASNSFYGIAKNGTHYVENGTGGNNYGGATKCAEVYRLFIKAAKGGRPRLQLTTTLGASPTPSAGVWSLATGDATSDTYHVFIANKETAAIPLDVDFSALPIAADNPVFVEEVSTRAAGGVTRFTRLQAGKLPTASLPAQAVWLITVPRRAMSLSTRSAVADTQLGDGGSKTLTGGALAAMRVRADGTADGRRVALIRIPVPAGSSPDVHSVLLELDVATTSGVSPIQAHVYGVTDNSWSESSATWTGMASVLKANVSGGNEIKNNIVASQGTGARMLGQIVADSTVPTTRSLDVTEFVKSRVDGFASFLVVQDHRWDVAQPELTVGDTQAAGLLVSSRESGAAGPRLVALVPNPAPVAREACIRGGSFAGADVDEAALGYLMVKFSTSLDAARKAYFQFDLPSSGVDLNAPATFQISFNNTFAQQIQLWGMKQAVPGFSETMTWNSAPANDPASNGILTSQATPIGGAVMINPGAGLLPYTFTLPRLGDHLFGNQVTLILSGMDDPANASGGLRIAPGSATLGFGMAPAPPWMTWQQARFGTDWQNEARSGAAADPDQDGVVNLLEYALAGDPLVAQAGLLPTIQHANGGVEFRFSRNPALTDLRITLQAAGTLDGVWTDFAMSERGAPFNVLNAIASVTETTGSPTRLVTFAIGDGATWARFLRLRINQLDP